MILKDIKIRNFRCFKEFSVSFGKNATVIFGKNGSGKTTLIHALHKALSFIMYSDKLYLSEKVKGKWKRRLAQVLTITNNNPYLKVEGYRKDDFNNHDDRLIEIEAQADLERDFPIRWTMSAFATNNRLRPSEFVEAFRSFYSWHIQTDNLPVLAYYSDCFPHKEDTKKSTLKKKIAKLRNFGYFDWNAVEGCTKEWITKLETNFFNIRQGRDLVARLSANGNDNGANEEVIKNKSAEILIWQTEIDAIENCLKRFSKGLAQEQDEAMEIMALGIHSENHNLCVITKSGKEISFIHLPSGYKRLFSLVLDLAFRCYILNKRDFANASGIAIVDEIDLHLHPGLEQTVVIALKDTFPNIQFIFTTHSPLVISNLPTENGENCIVSMSENHSEPKYVNDAFGLDYDSSIETVMGVTLRTGELNSLMESYCLLENEGLKDKADEFKQLIIKFVGSEEQFQERLQAYKRGKE